MARLTVLMGAPGSGKSTYAKKFANVVTTDGPRGRDPGDILHGAYKRVNELLAAGKDVVLDTTAANPNIRKAAVGIAQKHGAQCDVRVLDTPLDVCLKSRSASELDVRRIHDSVSRQIPGLSKEGFKSVSVVRDRK